MEKIFANSYDESATQAEKERDERKKKKEEEDRDSEPFANNPLTDKDWKF
jgi:hypothetical protein